jgi:hypothetical protein
VDNGSSGVSRLEEAYMRMVELLSVQTGKKEHGGK